MEHVSAAALVAEAKNRTENLTPQQFRSELDGDVVILDIREPEESGTTGFIGGAVSAPRGMLEFWADPTSPYHRAEFDRSKRTLLYCASGGRSALAVDRLMQMGYSDVAHLDGGLNAWAAKGFDVRTEEDAPES